MIRVYIRFLQRNMQVQTLDANRAYNNKTYNYTKKLIPNKSDVSFFDFSVTTPIAMEGNNPIQLDFITTGTALPGSLEM